MFAFRDVWTVQEGKMQDARDLISKTVDQLDSGAVQRLLYTPKISADQLVYEELWDSLEERDAAWEAYNARLEEAGFWEDWHKVADRHLETQMWEVKVWR